jgi:hypothetical protein
MECIGENAEGMGIGRISFNIFLVVSPFNQVKFYIKSVLKESKTALDEGMMGPLSCTGMSERLGLLGVFERRSLHCEHTC